MVATSRDRGLRTTSMRKLGAGGGGVQAPTQPSGLMGSSGLRGISPPQMRDTQVGQARGALTGRTQGEIAKMALAGKPAEATGGEAGGETPAPGSAYDAVMSNYDEQGRLAQETANAQGAMMQRQMQARGARMGLSGPSAMGVATQGMLAQNALMNQAAQRHAEGRTQLELGKIGYEQEEGRYQTAQEQMAGGVYGSMDEGQLGAAAAAGDKQAEEALRIKMGYSPEDWVSYRDSILGKMGSQAPDMVQNTGDSGAKPGYNPDGTPKQSGDGGSWYYQGMRVGAGVPGAKWVPEGETPLTTSA